MKKYLDISLKYIKVQKRMKKLTIIGVTLATALIVAIGNLYYSAYENKIQQSIKEYGNYKYRFERIDKETANNVEGDKRIKNPALGREEGYSIIKTDSKKQSQIFIGLDAFDERALKNIFTIELDKGRYPQNSNEIIVSKELLRRIPGNKNVEDYVEVPLGSYPFEVDNKFNPIMDQFIWKPLKMKNFKIVGVMKNEVYKQIPRPLIDYTIITFLDEKEKSIIGDNSYKCFTTAENKYKIEELVSSLKVVYIQPMPLSKNVEGEPKSQVKFQNYTDAVISSRSIFNNINILAPTVIIILFVMAMIYNSFNISILERIRQFGILRCIGATVKQINRIIMRETMIILIIALPTGLLIGTFGVKAILLIFNEIAGYKVFNMMFYNEMLINSTVIIILAVLIAAFRASVTERYLTPVEATNNFSILNGEIFRDNMKMFRLAINENKPEKEHILVRLFKIEGNMAYKNVDRNRKRNKICLASLAFSIILFILLTNFFMVTSFDVERMAPSSKWNLEYMRKYDYLKNDDINNITKIKGVKSLYKDVYTDTLIKIPNSSMSQLYDNVLIAREKYGDGIIRFGKTYKILETKVMEAQDNLRIYDEFKESGEISESSLNDNGVIIINSGEKEIVTPVAGGAMQEEISKISDITKYKVGDILTVPLNKEGKLEVLNLDNPQDYSETDKSIDLKIIAVLTKDPLNDNKDIKEDFGVIVSKEAYKKLGGNMNINRILVNGDVDQRVRAEMIKGIKEYSDTNVDNYVDYEEVVAKAKIDAKEKYKNGLVFGGLILIMGMLNVANTLMANILVRRKELGSLRAIGMTEEQMVKMVVLEGGFMGYKASVPAIIISIFLTIGAQVYMLQNKSRVSVIIWLVSIILSVSLIIILTLISTISPAKSLGNMSIVDNIKSEEV